MKSLVKPSYIEKGAVFTVPSEYCIICLHISQLSSVPLQLSLLIVRLNSI